MDRSPATDSPPAPLPIARAKCDRASSFWKALVSITPRKLTEVALVLGTSIPTMDLPGTGASIRMLGAARARARSLAREVIRSTFTRVLETSSRVIVTSPFLSFSLLSLCFRSQPGSTPNWVTVGPAFICTTLASTP